MGSSKTKLSEKKQTKDKLEKLSKDSKGEKEQSAGKNEEYSQEDEFNPSLAAMEEEIKPQVISTMTALSKKYIKLIYD